MACTPLVSIVIPVFNGQPYLSITLTSVLEQSYSNLEIVITDGGSTDGSRQWLEEYSEQHIVKGYLPEGSGAAANWTLACELSSGKYVKLLCQDDVLYPDAITKQVQDLEKNPDARIAFAQRDIIDARGKILSQARGCQGLDDGIVDGYAALFAGFRAGTNVYGEPVSVLFEREAMLASLPWQDTMPFLLDMMFYSKILSQHPGVVRREAVGAFRISSSSWSTRLAKEHRRQFHAWQEQVIQLLEGVGWRNKFLARANTEKVTLLRRAAYAWLSFRNKMD